MTVLERDDGAFTLLENVTTLDEDSKVENTTAEFSVHPEGRFVYVSNRGHDTIAVFQRVPATGRLVRVQLAPCGGANPRHFAITPDGSWLLCAHQDSYTLAALPLDRSTGLLGEPRAIVSCPSPVCLLFLPQGRAPSV